MLSCICYKKNKSKEDYEKEGQSIHHHGVDSWEWVADQSGIYSTQSAYEVLLEEAAVESIEECFEVLWKIRIPSKVAVFAWRLLRDRLPLDKCRFWI